MSVNNSNPPISNNSIQISQGVQSGIQGQMQVGIKGKDFYIRLKDGTSHTISVGQDASKLTPSQQLAILSKLVDLAKTLKPGEEFAQQFNHKVSPEIANLLNKDNGVKNSYNAMREKSIQDMEAQTGILRNDPNFLADPKVKKNIWPEFEKRFPQAPKPAKSTQPEAQTITPPPPRALAAGPAMPVADPYSHTELSPALRDQLMQKGEHAEPSLPAVHPAPPPPKASPPLAPKQPKVTPIIQRPPQPPPSQGTSQPAQSASGAAKTAAKLQAQLSGARPAEHAAGAQIAGFKHPNIDDIVKDDKISPKQDKKVALERFFGEIQDPDRPIGNAIEDNLRNLSADELAALRDANVQLPKKADQTAFDKRLGELITLNMARERLKEGDQSQISSIIDEWQMSGLDRPTRESFFENLKALKGSDGITEDSFKAFIAAYNKKFPTEQIHA